VLRRTISKHNDIEIAFLLVRKITTFIHGLILYTSAEGGVLLKQICFLIYLLWLSAVTSVCFLRYSSMFSTEQSIKPKSYPHF